MSDNPGAGPTTRVRTTLDALAALVRAIRQLAHDVAPYALIVYGVAKAATPNLPADAWMVPLTIGTTLLTPPAKRAAAQ